MRARWMSGKRCRWGEGGGLREFLWNAAPLCQLLHAPVGLRRSKTPNHNGNSGSAWSGRFVSAAGECLECDTSCCLPDWARGGRICL